MRYYVIAVVIILLLAVGVYAGFSLGHSTADDRFADAYRDAENRIESLERELEGSIERVSELRERNREAEHTIAGIQRDRNQLAEIVESYARTIDDLKGVNRRLRDAILVSTRSAIGVEQNVEDLGRILRDIEAQQ